MRERASDTPSEPTDVLLRTQEPRVIERGACSSVFLRSREYGACGATP